MIFRKSPTFERDLERQREYRAGMNEAAEAVKAAAERNTPRGTGRTADSYVVEGNVVGNTDPFFHLTEFGSVNNPAYAPLRRGVRQAGLRLDEEGRR